MGACLGTYGAGSTWEVYPSDGIAGDGVRVIARLEPDVSDEV